MFEIQCYFKGDAGKVLGMCLAQSLAPCKTQFMQIHPHPGWAETWVRAVLEQGLLVAVEPSWHPQIPSTVHLKWLCILFLHIVIAWEGMFMHIYGVKGQLAGVGSLPLPCNPWGLNLGHKACQASIATYCITSPTSGFFKNNKRQRMTCLVFSIYHTQFQNARFDLQAKQFL